MNLSPERVRELQTVLEAEIALYVELRGLLQRERELIVNLDAVRLEDTVRQKEALAEEGKLLEESRIDVAVRLAADLDLGPERPTLSQICDRIGVESAPLRRLHSRLVALVGAVRELRDANAGFAGESLLQVRATLQLLGRLLPTDPTYTTLGGTDAGRVAAGQLVRRSA